MTMGCMAQVPLNSSRASGSLLAAGLKASQQRRFGACHYAEHVYLLLPAGSQVQSERGVQLLQTLVLLLILPVHISASCITSAASWQAGQGACEGHDTCLGATTITRCPCARGLWAESRSRLPGRLSCSRVLPPQTQRRCPADALWLVAQTYQQRQPVLTPKSWYPHCMGVVCTRCKVDAWLSSMSCIRTSRSASAGGGCVGADSELPLFACRRGN